MNKTIWMCWFQGEHDPEMPELNRNCIKRWRELNIDWKVNVLSQRTISNYIPEFLDIVKNSPERTFAAKSDLLRILLLSKFGGVWVDSSVYLMFPLKDFIFDIVNDVGFFAYRFKPRANNQKRGDRETVSWFLCADKPSHPLINAWKESFVEKFKKLETWKYFTFHETLAELYDSNSEVKFTIDNMIQINQIRPHSALKNWEGKKHSYMYKRPNLKL